MTGSPPSTGCFAFPLFALLHGLEQLSYETTTAATLTSGIVRAKSTTTLRLDRLFDIFPESYWGRYTSLTEIALTATLTGSARIEIRRRNALTGEEQALVQVHCEGQSQSIAIPIALQQPGSDEAASYLIAVLDLSAGAELHNLHWSAATPGACNVRIAGVICTFNQEEMLTDNLAQISAAPAFLQRLFVVNQGAPGLADRIAPAVGSQTPITCIDQPNFGGAGGFTRGIIESLDDPQVTHILLMDDDIRAQPSLLARIATILAYAGERHCIGGAMLDIHAPTKLFTCGDRINPDRPAIINIAPPEGCDDVTTDAGRDFVALNHKPDFNGWWCFAFPVEAVRQCGLPLPLFIRGDDVEFGFRLSRAGFPTIGWPGVVVWHLPFRLKIQPWQAFYDRRNMLFLNEAHGLFSRRRLARSAWRSFTNAIRAHDHARARAIVEGVEAFNKGASHLASWSSEDHSALLGRMFRGHGWRSIIVLSARALSAIATLHWPRRSDPDAVPRLSSTGFWRDYLSISSPRNAPSHDKGFASHPDDGIAPSQQIQATSVKSCDPI